MPPAARTALAALLFAAPAAAGCFYADPINERPSADIQRVTPGPIARGGTLSVFAEVFDPDGDMTDVAWAAFVCSDGACDAAPAATGAARSFSVTVPALTASGLPSTTVRVELDITDSWGAKAVPHQELELDLVDAGPTLLPQAQGRVYRGQHPLPIPVRIIAKVDDADDGPAAVTIDDPVLLEPRGTTLAGSSITYLPDESSATERVYELIVDEPGNWDVRFTGHDPLGAEVETTLTVPFADDQWPCIGAADPGFPPEGASVVLDAPRRFALLSVQDDLDIWPPPPPSDPYLDATSFRWWLASPATGGALVALDGVDGAAVDLDPARYQPGDALELRVEIVDRADRALCDASLPSCEALAGCFQRRSWTVEVR
ncbi:MAG: hypothetical protein H6709_16740 [Kofleriaceae bacterium]|nr:hypothetical protein [Myxococcales bacterium]MCB9561721.1 hypothetical protein [Kofleriaceae bacterium]MCB9573729.1 hypothetical protein [Kofleriaceae bacterium]